MAYKCLKCSPLLWPPSSIFRPIWLHLLFTFTLEVLAWAAHMHSHWRIKLRNKHVKVISKMQECMSRRNSGKYFRRLLLTIKFSNRLPIVPFAKYAFINLFRVHHVKLWLCLPQNQVRVLSVFFPIHKEDFKYTINKFLPATNCPHSCLYILLYTFQQLTTFSKLHLLSFNANSDEHSLVFIHLFHSNFVLLGPTLFRLLMEFGYCLIQGKLDFIVWDPKGICVPLTKQARSPQKYRHGT